MRNVRRRRRLFKFFLPRKWFVAGVLLVVFALLGLLWNEFFLDHSKFQPRAGGIYTEATVGEIINLNPLAPNSSSFDRDLQALSFAGLMFYDPMQASVEDGLAEMQLLDQGRTYQLKLKESAKFSDGSTVDVADVLFTYETLIKNPQFKNEALRASFEYIDISVVDDRTVAFKLPEKNVFFPFLLTTAILPQREFSDYLLEEVLDPDLPFNRRPIGAGPYVINNIIPEDDGLVRVFLKRNPHYYRSEPYLDEIVMYVYADETRLMANHDWPSLFSRLSFNVMESFKETLFDEYRSKIFYQPRFTGVFFNLDQPVVSNVNLRRALKQTLNLSRFLEAGWEPIDSPFFYENIDGEWPAASPDLARATLRDNGFPYNSRLDARTLERQGDPVRIKMITTTQPAVYSRMAQSIKNTWEAELDIEVELLVLPPEQLQVALRDRLYDVILYGQDFSRNLDNLSVWHSSQAGRLNLSNITRDDVDFVIEEIRFSGSPSDYQQLQNRIDVLVPVIPLATPQKEILYTPLLKQFNETWGRVRHLSDRFAFVEKWHYFEKRDWDWDRTESKTWGFIKWLFSGKALQSAPTPELEVEPVVDPENAEALPAEEPEAETIETDNPVSD